MKYILIALVALTVYSPAIANEDLCENLEGVQETMPKGYSSVGSPLQCYELPTPVTIDIVPEGGQPKTIDINPEGSEEPKQIDVNPFSPVFGSVLPESVSTTSAFGSADVKVNKTIKTLEDLQPFVLHPSLNLEEKQQVIMGRIVTLLTKMIEILKKEKELEQLPIVP